MQLSFGIASIKTQTYCNCATLMFIIIITGCVKRNNPLAKSQCFRQNSRFFPDFIRHCKQDILTSIPHILSKTVIG